MKNLIFSVFILIMSVSYAQKESAHWYFGYNAGLDFTSEPPVPIPDISGKLNTHEGCSTISDKNGNLLCYTDGISVYDKNHNIINNKDEYNNYILLNGHTSSTQSGIIIPKPNNKNIFYIFTTDVNMSLSEGSGLNYSVVDMTLNSGNGGITITNTKLPLGGKQKCSEKLTAVKHANGKDYWVVTHYEDSFYSFLINSSGVNETPVVSKIGSKINNGIGSIKISPNGKKIASASYSFSLNLYDFNTSTGKVTNEIILESLQKHYYGIEFSPNNNLLYVSTENSDHLMQYDLTAISIPNSVFYLDKESELYALQLAIDGKIYIANGFNHLSVINNPNVKGAGCDYNKKTISLGGKISRLGLPPFITSFFNINIIVDNICLGDTAFFSFDTDMTDGEKIYWNFGDETNDNSNNNKPTHIYI